MHSLVTLNNRIVIQDIDSGELFAFFLVEPDRHDAKTGKISISTSLGAALIGKSTGTVVAWQAPSRIRRFEVRSVSQSS